uniref:ADP-ribosylation factor-like protein 2-binding protein n=1 Tax=Monodon monoceros TaxID=40151 RepID=A0A8C6F5F6_MONMO
RHNVEGPMFMLSISFTSEAEFEAVVGYLEDIIMNDEFQLLQRKTMDDNVEHHKDEGAGDILNMLLTLTDFKDMLLHYRAEEGQALDFSSSSVETWLRKSPSMPASQKNLWYQLPPPGNGTAVDIIGPKGLERLWLMVTGEYILER